MTQRRGLVVNIEWAMKFIQEDEPKTYELRNRRCLLARGTEVDLIASGTGRRYDGQASFTVIGSAHFEENIPLTTHDEIRSAFEHHRVPFDRVMKMVNKWKRKTVIAWRFSHIVPLMHPFDIVARKGSGVQWCIWTDPDDRIDIHVVPDGHELVDVDDPEDHIGSEDGAVDKDVHGFQNEQEYGGVADDDDEDMTDDYNAEPGVGSRDRD